MGGRIVIGRFAFGSITNQLPFFLTAIYGMNLPVPDSGLNVKWKSKADIPCNRGSDPWINGGYGFLRPGDGRAHRRSIPSAAWRPSVTDMHVRPGTEGPWLCALASRRVCPFEEERRLWFRQDTGCLPPQFPQKLEIRFAPQI